MNPISPEPTIKNPKAKLDRPRRKLRLFESSQKSQLSASLEGTYNGSYLLGYGFDVVRAAMSNNALKPFTPQSSSVKNSTDDIRSVTNQEEMQMELELALKGDFSINGVDVGVESEYIHKIKASNTSMSIIANYGWQDSAYSVAPNADYKPTEEAMQYFLDYGQEEFRAKYGDYYIAGFKYGATFNGVYTCEASSAEQFDAFKLKLTAEMPKLFSAEGSVDFSNLVSEYDITVSVQVVMSGYEGTPPPIDLNPETILQLLEWFKNNEVGTPVSVLLLSYSGIMDNYNDSIDISPDVFTRVKMLYNNYWMITILYNSLNPFYQQRFDSVYQNITTGIQSNYGTFLNDPQELDSYYTQSQNFLDELQSNANYAELHQEVVEKMKYFPEPDTNVEYEAGMSSIFAYGITQQSNIYGIDIKVESQNFTQIWHSGYRDQIFNWSNGDRLIIGWKVESNKEKNGKWMKTSNGMATLSNELDLYIKSGFDRGIDYTVTVYSVASVDFNFS